MNPSDLYIPIDYDPTRGINPNIFIQAAQDHVVYPPTVEVEPLWTNEPQVDRTPFDFVGPEPGPTCETNSGLETLKLFFTDKIVEEIVNKLNRHYNSEYYMKKRKRPRVFKPITPDEFWIWMAILILIGVNGKQDIKHNWTRDPLLCNPIFGEKMPRDRFDMIFSCCNFGFDDEEDVNDNLGGVRELLAHFNGKFQQHYNLKKEVVIDKRLVLWKGQRPKKGTEGGEVYWEFRFYCLLEAGTGYVWNLLPEEHGNTRILPLPMMKEFFMPGQALMTLMVPILNRGHLLACHLLYTDIVLFRRLAEAHTDCVGAVADNRRHLPRSVLQKEWNDNDHGKTAYEYSGKFCVMNYFNRKDQQFLSSVGSPVPPYPSEKPGIVSLFENLMESTNIESPRFASVEVTKSRLEHFHKKAIVHFIKMSLSNAYIISQQMSGIKNDEFYKFRMDIVRSIFVEHSHQPDNPVVIPPNDWVRLTAPHCNIETYKRQRYCQVCSKVGIVKYVSKGCFDCGVALCIDDCFELFHTVIDYGSAKRELIGNPETAHDSLMIPIDQ